MRAQLMSLAIFSLTLLLIYAQEQEKYESVDCFGPECHDILRQKSNPIRDVVATCSGYKCANVMIEYTRRKRSSFGDVKNGCSGTFCSNNQVEIQRGKRSPFGNVENQCSGTFCSNNGFLAKIKNFLKGIF
uniref:Uncharacterized protein n=1 Tax=Acrobeloides nanus TaxID=290746 RepID=A0A914EIE9_9BILA